MIAVARDVQEVLQQVRLLADEPEEGLARSHEQRGGRGSGEGGRQHLVAAEEVRRGEGARRNDRLDHHPVAPGVDDVDPHTPLEQHVERAAGGALSGYHVVLFQGIQPSVKPLRERGAEALRRPVEEGDPEQGLP